MSCLKCFLADNEIYGFLDNRALVVVVPGLVVRLFVMGNDLIGLGAEYINVVVAYQLIDFHVGAVGGTERYRTV